MIDSNELLMMGRNYKRKTILVSEEKKKLAVAAMEKNGWSIRKTGVKMKIPWTSLRDFLKRGSLKMGRPRIFTEQEELSFVSHLKVVGDFGQPVDKFGLRLIVQAYLNKAKRVVPVNFILYIVLIWKRKKLK